MQRLIVSLAAFAALAAASCHEASKTVALVASETDSAGRMRSYEMVDFDFSRFEGAYSGDFGGAGDIRLAIRHAGGRNAVGYSLHKGLRRNISGGMAPAGDGFDFKLAEPGDNPYDGVFEFYIDTVRFALKGKWTPASTEKLTAKSFTLQRIKKDTSVKYDPDRMFTDSLGDMTLATNGQASYSYYERRNGMEVGQLIVFKGNWRQSGKNILIEWQPNTVFPSRKSSFAIVSEADFNGDDYTGEVTIRGEGREFYVPGP